MAKFEFDNQPKLTYLTETEVKLMHQKALEILERTGVYFQSENALKIFEKKGCAVDYEKSIVKFKPSFIEDCVRQVPETFQLYDRDGNPSRVVGDNSFTFDAGSTGLFFLEQDNLTARDCTAEDLRKIFILADYLESYGIQGTALAPTDVPTEICDVYRVYLALKNTSKPISSSAFEVAGVKNIAEICSAVCGGSGELRKKPFIVIDVCSNTPLQYSHVECENLIDLAGYGIPVETISCPIPGTASPITLAGSVLLHLAESLAGMALVQSVNPGNPMIMGGAPMTFDMHTTTASLNSVESSIMAGCYAQIARYYGVPVHCYAGLADSKIMDTQAGLEAAMSGLAAVLGGVHCISGPGMLNFVNTFSLEKFVVDNEIISMTKRIFRGVEVSEETLAVDTICALGHGADYLSQKETLKRFKDELYIPAPVIDKSKQEKWEKSGKLNTHDRAKTEVDRILKEHKPKPLGEKREELLDSVFRNIMSSNHVETVPYGPKL